MNFNIALKVWRQISRNTTGHWGLYRVEDVSPDWSFLDLLDYLNEQLIAQGERVVEFDHDCREGICGACGFLVNGLPHGPLSGTTVCQLHMREFSPGETVTIEPYRVTAFPVVCDLKVDRSSLDRIMEAGGYISTNLGAAPEANCIPIARDAAQAAFHAAACIGCGACVASCQNASAALFTAAKTSHLAQLPQGRLEAKRRVLRLVQAMDREGFGHCSNTEACSVVCPQAISTREIGRMNWEYQRALWTTILGSDS